ncbi:DUF882 domain-containing protein [Shewanella sp. NIFS-20-20]|nr:DUF882 domain-containing protein [Shewanella sp. NIFS-20-20]MBV7315093.1 DUF882 domain-containing protein [Shewanella sp. NIFS-20-20]
MGGAALACAIPSKVLASRSTTDVRTLSLMNLHTGEHDVGHYWANGDYQSNVIQRFNHLLRDHRTNDVMAMDQRLYDLLFRLRMTLETDQQIQIISGYRSLKTNNMLAAKSSGVAKHSYHTKGMAIDLAIPGTPLSDIRDAAKELRLGGVGYYPRSGFVHVDCGPVRSW